MLIPPACCSHIEKGSGSLKRSTLLAQRHLQHLRAVSDDDHSTLSLPSICAGAMETPDDADISEAHRLELLYVKALFLEKRHRECIVACRKILQDHQDDTGAQCEHPLRTTFMKFYLALSHDELARAMHNLSQAKIPAFDQAAHLYDEAMTTLPTAEECISYLDEEPQEELTDDFKDDFEEEDEADDQPSPAKLTPTSRHDSVRSAATAEKGRPWSSLHSSASMSPPTRIRHSSPPMRSPPVSVSGLTASEFDDLESHESFNEIMTPSRMPGRLERDYSSMSLIAPTRKQMQQGLMRPVRMGSPPKPYYLSDESTQHFKRFVVQQRTQLPRLDTSPTTTAPARKQLLTASEQASPIDGIDSPVSPLGSEGESVLSELSTISPISPETPMNWRPHPITHRDIQLQKTRRALTIHIHALRTQLQSHQALLQTAKLQTRAAQLDHALARTAARGPGNALPSRLSGASTERPQSQQSQKAWPTSAEDVRGPHKQSRILAGRARDWRRDRFDPIRYARLADAALSEL